MKIVFYDTETSGIKSWEHEIIQIAAIAIEINGTQWIELETFERKLQFNLDKASEDALEINSYDCATWATDAVSQSVGLIAFNKFIKPYGDVERISKRTGRPFFNVRTGAHNAAFDDGFVRAWYKSENEFCPMDYAYYDTLQLARWRYINCEQQPENFKLETMCQVFGIPLDAHDALNDVRATARLACALTGGSYK